MHSIHYSPLLADMSYITNGDFRSFFRTHMTLWCRVWES